MCFTITCLDKGACLPLFVGLLLNIYKKSDWVSE